jgi:type I site-specific restriction endonuclease
LAPTFLDKAAGKLGGYYPDYSVWEKAFPVLIVEAKAPNVNAEVGYREASLYRLQLGAGIARFRRKLAVRTVH